MRSALYSSQTLYTLALGILIAFALFFFGVHHQDLTIDTSLKDLTPPLLSDQQTGSLNETQLNTAMENITEHARQHASLMLYFAEDQTVNASILIQAHEALVTALSKAPDLITVSPPAEDQAELITLTQQHPFNFLTQTQRAYIKNTSTEQLIKDALRRMYRTLDATQYVFEFQHDPLGLLSNYLNTQLQIFPDQTNDVRKYINLRLSAAALERKNQQRLGELFNTAIIQTERDYNLSIARSGMFFFALDAAQTAENDIKFISTISSIGVLFLLLFVFRSLWPLGVAFLSIIVGVGVALAITHTIFSSIHVLTIVFGASLIGIVVDYSIHFFYHNTKHGSDDSTPRVTPALERALLLSLTTSLIGYGALGVADLTALKKIAVFSCAGTATAWLCVMVIGRLYKPKADTKYRNKASSSSFIQHNFIDWLISSALKINQQKSASLLISILIIGLSVSLLNFLPNNDNPRFFFKPSLELIEQQKVHAQHTLSFEPSLYLIASGASAKTVYEALAHAHQSLRSTGLGDDDHVSMLTLLPSLETQRINYQAQEKLYSETGVIPKFYEALGLTPAETEKTLQAYQKQQNNLIKPTQLLSAVAALPPLWQEKDGHIIAFLLIKQGAMQRLNAVNAPSQLLNSIALEHPQLTAIHAIAQAEHALAQQRQIATHLLGLAYALVALLFLIYYRNLGTLRILWVPALASSLALAGAALLGQAITLFHLMALFLLLGLGMDYLIFAKEMKQTDNKTQWAITLSALTSALSFGLLALSNIPVAAAFGTIVLIGNSINFLAALVYCEIRKQEIQYDH